MSAEKLVKSWERLAERLLVHCEEDEQLRTALRQFAQAVLDRTAEATDQESPIPAGIELETAPSEATASADGIAANVPSPRSPHHLAANDRPRGAPQLAATARQEAATYRGESGSGESALPADELARQLWPTRATHVGEEDASGAPVLDLRETVARWDAPSEADLDLIEARCRLKSEGARWAFTRQRRLSEGADFRLEIEPMDRDLIARAKQVPDCFLWMNHPTGPTPLPLSQWEQVATCFDALGDAVRVVRAVLDDVENYRDLFENSLELLAEAQSALRTAIVRIDGPADPDQQRVFNWLRTTAAEQQIFIQRYMRADDPADPGQGEDIRRRVEELDARFDQAKQGLRLRRKRLNKLRYISGRLQEGTDDAATQWKTLIQTVEELIAEGLPPSNRELRDLLLPIVDALPEMDELPLGLSLVLREIDRYLANRPAEVAEYEQEPSPDVRLAASLLSGKTVVLIGGERRQHAQQALEQAFGLAELIWIATREHESVSSFEPYVARPDLAVVVLAIRWSSHSYGDVKQFCDAYGKPLVRLPAGYNPNQVAAHIVAQCSDRLREH